MRYLIPVCVFCLLQIVIQEAKAQLNPMGALYFQNQYLANPALAGMKGLDLNLGYRAQWNSIPGSPTTQTLTADYALTGKAGIGLNVYSEKAGLFKRLRSVASYAYHLPLDASNSKLSFGLSLGFLNERISNEDINGTVNDLSIANYNQRDAYMDGDFGMAYTNDRLTIQAALPNMKSVFKKDLINGSVNQPTFFSAISYKIRASGINRIGIEPKIVYRGVKGLDNILDIGANLTYMDRINFYGMYQTSESASFGIGLAYESFRITGIYTTTTSALSAYTNGTFELGLKANIF